MTFKITLTPLPPLPAFVSAPPSILRSTLIPSTSRDIIPLTLAACFHHSKIPRNYCRPGPAARDRVIDFGKYKGKMLGSLPSSYLKWITKNLRAGDSEEWARLADEVLSDPIYRDRMEWELAEKVLNGERSHNSNSSSEGAVSELLEISERFGWDNEDKIGWGKIDFGLLGTSKGARIPRAQVDGAVKVVGSTSSRMKKGEDILSSSEEEEKRRGRKERRERMRRRRSTSSSSDRDGSSGMNMMMMRRRMEEEEEEEEENRNVNPFPGRESLLNKVLLNRCHRPPLL